MMLDPQDGTEDYHVDPDYPVETCPPGPPKIGEEHQRHWRNPDTGMVTTEPASSDFPAGRPGKWEPVSIVPEFPTVTMTHYTGLDGTVPRISVECPGIDVDTITARLTTAQKAAHESHLLQASAAMRFYLARALAQWSGREQEREEAEMQKAREVLRTVLDDEVDEIVRNARANPFADSRTAFADLLYSRRGEIRAALRNLG